MSVATNVGPLVRIHEYLFLGDPDNFVCTVPNQRLFDKILNHDMHIGDGGELPGNHFIFTSVKMGNGEEKSLFDVPNVAKIFMNIGLHPPLRINGKYVTFCLKPPSVSILESYNQTADTRKLSKEIRKLMNTSFMKKKEISKFSLIEIKPHVYRPVLFGSGSFGGSAIRFIRFPNYYVQTFLDNDSFNIFKDSYLTDHLTEHIGPCLGQMIFSNDEGRTYNALMQGRHCLFPKGS